MLDFKTVLERHPLHHRWRARSRPVRPGVLAKRMQHVDVEAPKRLLNAVRHDSSFSLSYSAEVVSLLGNRLPGVSTGGASSGRLLVRLLGCSPEEQRSASHHTAVASCDRWTYRPCSGSSRACQQSSHWRARSTDGRSVCLILP